MNENGTVLKICKNYDFWIQLSFVLFFGWNNELNEVIFIGQNFSEKKKNISAKYCTLHIPFHNISIQSLSCHELL